jgi:hypothetical protein
MAPIVPAAAPAIDIPIAASVSVPAPALAQSPAPAVEIPATPPATSPAPTAVPVPGVEGALDAPAAPAFVAGEEPFISPELLTQLGNTPAGRYVAAATALATSMPDQAELLQTPEGLEQLFKSRTALMHFDDMMTSDPKALLETMLLPDAKGNTPATALVDVLDRLPEPVQQALAVKAYDKMWGQLHAQLRATQPPAVVVQQLQNVISNTALPDAAREAARAQLDAMVTPSWDIATALQTLENVAYGSKIADASIYMDLTKPVAPPWERRMAAAGTPAASLPTASPATQAYQEMAGPALAELIEKHVSVPPGTLPAVADAMRREVFSAVEREITGNPQLNARLKAELGADMRAGGKPDRAIRAFSAAARATLFRIGPAIAQKYAPTVASSSPEAPGGLAPVSAQPAPVVPRRADFPPTAEGEHAFYRAVFGYTAQVRKGGSPQV